MTSDLHAHLSDQELQDGLPHLFAWNWYEWAWEFFSSKNRENFLCAANQVSKSSTNIRKCIDWATDKSKWPELWPLFENGPTQFWYFYPDLETATAEWETKWAEFMPSGWAKDDPEYGWKETYGKGRQIKQINFNNGVVVRFKTYSQKITNLQAGTVFAVFADEEMPVDFLGEIQARLNATDGYFHLVFTATLGQEHWRRCLEEQGTDLETHEGALKLQVSLYDCQKYKDGTPSHWTLEKIQRAEARCATEAEKLKRIYGRFVVSGGRTYEAFDTQRNRTKNHKLPKDWHLYSGVDIGSGGEDGHPSAIAFVAVSPDYTQGRVWRGWRGDGIVTTAGDVVQKYKEMRLDKQHHLEQYDHQCADFYAIATRAGLSFTPADKTRDKGIQTLNTLFKYGMLKIMDDDPELDKLVVELCSLKENTPKTKAKDDFCDALRYACAKIPWDWSAIGEELLTEAELLEKSDKKPPKKSSAELRRDYYMGLDEKEVDPIENEFNEMNDLYGT